MRETHSLRFASFRLDLGAGQLWRGDEARPLTRKAFAALHYLAGRAGQLVSKDELIAAVWAVPYVSDMALAACIREIRRALGDVAQTPQLLETVRGRGYRFLAPVSLFPASDTPPLSTPPPYPPPPYYPPPPLPPSPPPLLLGRDPAAAQFDACFASAVQGRRQV